jgi:hypothetical protein
MERIGRLPMEIPRREVYRYMGYKNGNRPDAEADKIIEECIRELENTAAPSAVYRIDPLIWEEDHEDHMTLSGIDVRSSYLAKNLRRCKESVLVAATLSASVDVLLRRYSKLEITKALALQAASAAFIEAYLDAIEEEILKTLEPKGLSLRPRFSPGFGDFGTSYQEAVLQALQAGKLLGICQAQDSEMMIPSKSVTAVIGICAKGDESVPMPEA